MPLDLLATKLPILDSFERCFFAGGSGGGEEGVGGGETEIERNEEIVVLEGNSAGHDQDQ